MKPGYGVLLLGAAACCISTAYSGARIGERLSKALLAAKPDDRILVWVFLNDKGSHELLKNAVPLTVVSDRSIQRRLNVCSPAAVVDYTDLPVEESYVDQIASRVLGVRQRSKWFNAVSVVATPAQIAGVGTLPFVNSLDLVSRFRREPDVTRPAPATPGRGSDHLLKPGQVDSLNYGPSFGQVNQINVPAVHASGNHAEGVIVGVFDNGFRLLPSHEAFDSVRAHLIATHDYVDHKVSVVPNDTLYPFGFHGVSTLSTIAGYKPGQLIGPAYGASFILARTENDSSETPIEEDNWAAGIEWADSIGVQVTSTSLGYLGFDAPYTSLTWRDMNGRTAIISLAATMAARKGIVVVNAAGNEGPPALPADSNSLIAPADADSIVTAGAVTPNGIRASFSSCGPTYDGRIKPDVMAQGTGVYAADGGDPTGYILAGGTSFACPLTAGAAALIVKAFPHATPMQVLNALRNTASRHTTPDNFYGWGIVNALAAINSLTGVSPDNDERAASFGLAQNYPNPFNPGTWIRYSVPVPARVTLKIYNTLGQEVATLVDRDETASSAPRSVYWDGNDARGIHVASGVYFYRMTAQTHEGMSSAGFTTTREMVLLR